MKDVLQLPFIQIALPIIVTFVATALYQNKRIDDFGKRLDDLRDSLNRRMDGVERRLEGIEQTLKEIQKMLETHGNRIMAL